MHCIYGHMYQSQILRNYNVVLVKMQIQQEKLEDILYNGHHTSAIGEIHTSFQNPLLQFLKQEV
jgi:hypothetical protein